MAQLELTFPECIAVYNYVKTCFHLFQDDGGRLVLREEDYLQKSRIFRLYVFLLWKV